MATDYYSKSGSPSTSSLAQSSTMRAEFALVESGFAKLPGLTGNGLKVVRVNSGGSALEAATVTGSGNVVMDTSPTLVTPVIGAATGTSLAVSGQLTSTQATGTAPLVVSSTTLVPNLYVARAALADTATTNANLTGPITSSGNATSVASQTGTGTKFVMDTSPTLVTPTLGVATATSINKVTLTQPASAATLTIANNKTLTVNSSLALSGSDGTTMTFPSTSATVARTDAGQTFTGTQVFGAIDVNGGAIDGTPIGAASRAAADFTRITEELENFAPALNATQDVPWTNGVSQITANGSNTLTFSSVPAATYGASKTIYLSNLNSFTFPAAVNWGVGGKPSIAGACWVSLFSVDGGATIYATVVWQAV